MGKLKILSLAAIMGFSFLAAEEQQGQEPKKPQCPVPNCMWEWAYFQDLNVPQYQRQEWYATCTAEENEQTNEFQWDQGCLSGQIMMYFYQAYVQHRFAGTQQATEVFKVIDWLIENSVASRLTARSLHLSELQEESQDHCMGE